jgi:DNA-binding NarL/FixJ family response regulator
MKGEAPLTRTAATKILGEFTRLARRGPAVGVHPAENVSAREREVLGLLTKGATNKEIASSLGISENTVKNHLKNILEKLHLQNRVQAAAYAIRKGLAPPPNADS